MSDARRFVLDFIARLDRAYAAAGDASTCAASLMLARALVALADHLMGSHEAMPSMVASTLTAARAYLADPSDATYDALFEAGTASFPFGPGEGCYAVEELGHPACEVGSGCRSGAGTIAEFAYVSGYEAVAAVLRRPEFASVGGVE